MSVAAANPSLSSVSGAQADKLNLADFPDRISPMVVKELRQGLRSPIFVWAFIAMHVILALIVVSSTEANNKTSASLVFWWAVLVPIVYLLPLRGFNALTDEIRLNTLDTLVMTRLTSWRITYGKWVAVASQILLLGITVLPYLIIRYFGGGMDLWLEIRFLFHYIMLGMILTALLVGFSWLKSFLLRTILTLGCGMGITGLAAFTSFEILSRQSYDYTHNIQPVEGSITAAYYLLGAYLIFFLLDFAAAQIAPLAENRSTLRRVVTLLILGISLGLSYVSLPYAAGGLVIQIGIVALAGIDAATEHPRQLTILTRPFVQRGWLGRLAGRFLYPGWHAGIYFFVILLLFPLATSFTLQKWVLGFSPSSLMTSYWWTVPTAIIGQILLGIWIQRRFLSRYKSGFITFLIVQAGLMVFHGLCAMLAEAMDQPFMNLLPLPAPLSVLFFIEQGSHRLAGELGDVALMFTIGLSAIYLFMLFIMALREWKVTRGLELEVQQEQSAA
jgi:hypothetical protein